MYNINYVWYEMKYKFKLDGIFNCLCCCMEIVVLNNELWNVYKCDLRLIVWCWYSV